MGSLTLSRALSKQKEAAQPFVWTAEDQAAFELRNLSVAYAGSPALRGIDCRIAEDAVTAIMGPSGCGKSTLVKTLNRTLELTADIRVSGEVKFRGRDLYDASIDPRSVRRTVGIIHQRPVPFPMSILENVLFGAAFHGRINGEDRTEYARRFLERVGLWEEVKDRLSDRAERLSGGQQQRLCLARTLATQPSALLLDEPCSALDPYATRHIEEHVRDLRREFPIVIVTHNVAQARRVSDHVLFLYEGALLEAGPAERIFAAPSSKLARDFISGQFG